VLHVVRQLVHLQYCLAHVRCCRVCTTITVHSLLPQPPWWSRFLLRCTTNWTPCTGRCTGDPTLMPSLLGPDICPFTQLKTTASSCSRQEWPLTQLSVCLSVWRAALTRWYGHTCPPCRCWTDAWTLLGRQPGGCLVPVTFAGSVFVAYDVVVCSVCQTGPPYCLVLPAALSDPLPYQGPIQNAALATVNVLTMTCCCVPAFAG
jgi:hypothetical protein